MKRCSKCGAVKEREEFHIQRNSKDGLQSRCKDCAKLTSRTIYVSKRELFKARTAARKLAFPGRILARTRQRIYGLSPEDFNAKVQKQNNRCAVCQKVFIKTPCVDHNHITNKVRGILCGTCNRGIGLLGDSSERLSAALEYLKSYEI